MQDAISREDLLTLANNYPLIFEAKEQIAYQDGHYLRKRLSKSENLEVVMVCFKGKQSTSLHAHGGSECVVRCLEGRVHETTYQNGTNGLFPVHSRVIFKGDMKAVAPDLLHEITNLVPEGSVLLNFYSPPLPETDDEWMQDSLKSLTEWY
jgi:hypothetical protein